MDETDWSKPVEKHNFSKGNYDAARSNLQENKIPLCKDVEESWGHIKKAVLSVRDEFVPKRLIGKRTWKGEFPCDSNTFGLLKEKDRSFREWIHNHNTERGPSLRKRYNSARNKVRAHTRRLRRNHEISVASQAKEGNSKPFFSLARGRLKTRSGVAPLLKDKKDPCSIKHSDSDKSEILQTQFCGVFTVEPPGDPPTLALRTNAVLSRLQVSEEKVLSKLLKLDVSKSCGLDEMHPYLLKELAHEIAPALTNLFNLSLETGTVPADWRCAAVSPIFKKGSKKLSAKSRKFSQRGYHALSS